MMHHGHGHGRGHGHGGAAATTGQPAPTRGQSKGYVLIAVIYLLGLVMGALDMSIVNPARTVIQNTMSVPDSLGVWVVTIYTLAYAASIPIMGKLADRHGRKIIYLACIFLFGFGSLLCGLAHFTDTFGILLAARVIQALGGGGIMPVATAEFGTAFPEEKRGMALGVVGMVYGLASILGPSAGSAILAIFGQTEWQYIFFLNVPICLIVLILGVMKLPNSKADEVKPIDGLGILLLTALTLSLMYGLKNINFFRISSIAELDVWPFLLIFVVLLPLFVMRERRAADPIINITYFSNRNIVIGLICAVISGIVMMGTIFFPQFCENAMFMKSGSGGYFIAILGLASAVGAMGSGGMIDKHGVRPVLGFGFAASALGSLFMAFVACHWPNVVTVCATLFITGLGLGFTMGTPLNYMMLQNTDDAESNSALATLSLVRSIGTAVAPAIMVAFIAHAGMSMQDNLMAVMPSQVAVSPLPYAQELDDEMDKVRANEEYAEMLEGLDIPRLTDYEVVDVTMDDENSDFNVDISEEMVEQLQNSDVTTIVDTCKDMTHEIFGQISPQLIEEAQSGVGQGISTMQDKVAEMRNGSTEMGDGLAEMDSGMAELNGAIAEMDAKIAANQAKADQLAAQISQMEQAVQQMTAAMAGMPAEQAAQMQAQIDEMNAALPEMRQALAGINAGIDGMKAGRAEMQNAVSQMQSGRSELAAGRIELDDAIAEMEGIIAKLQAVYDAIPGLFEEAEANYMVAIDENADVIMDTYRQTLNGGFRGMAIFVAICSVIGLLMLIPYRELKPAAKPEEQEAPTAA